MFSQEYNFKINLVPISYYCTLKFVKKKHHNTNNNTRETLHNGRHSGKKFLLQEGKKKVRSDHLPTNRDIPDPCAVAMGHIPLCVRMYFHITSSSLHFFLIFRNFLREFFTSYHWLSCLFFGIGLILLVLFIFFEVLRFNKMVNWLFAFLIVSLQCET